MRWPWRIPFLGWLVFKVWKLDARRKLNWITPHLLPDMTLLEIGSGPGSVLSVFRAAGHRVTGIDITDTSYDDTLRPALYDGTVLPYADKRFDGACVLTVLHHTQDPEAILKEAARVAKRVYVIEDIFTSPTHRGLTKIADSLTNLEFFGHPHSNRDDAAWRETFTRLGLTLLHTSQKPMAGYFLQALYVLEGAENTPRSTAKT